MENMVTKIQWLNWQEIVNKLHKKGYVQIPNILDKHQCKQLIETYNAPNGYRKTVVMERYRFGLGEYKYFDYPLPNLIQTLRETIYPYLVPVANLWMNLLKIEKEFPATLQELKTECAENHQLKPTPLILKYGQGGFNTLHQDLYGDVYFPLQAALFLNEPEVDFAGGEFVLTQQVPRAQSKAMVLQPEQGSMVIFTTNFRPMKSAKGYYRAAMRHGVSEVRHGANESSCNRHTLGIIFHDAVS